MSPWEPATQMKIKKRFLGFFGFLVFLESSTRFKTCAP
jgi:hypothetical protein